MPTNVTSDRSVLRSKNAYRLKQELGSQGDIFEIDSSAAAVFVGPDSDLTGYQLTYYDQDAANELQTATISVGGPLVTSVNALLDTRVSQTGQLARILASTTELYQPDYERNLGGGNTVLRTIIIPPLVNLVFSFTPDLAGLPSHRADRVIRLYNIPADGTALNTTDVMIPMYGRRSATVQMLSTQIGWDVTFFQVNFDAAQTDGARFLAQYAGLGGVSLGDAARIDNFQLNTSRDVLQDQDNASAVVSIPAPFVNISGATGSGPVGQMDYLLMNFSTSQGSPGNPALFPAVFIRLSDNEV